MNTRAVPLLGVLLVVCALGYAAWTVASGDADEPQALELAFGSELDAPSMAPLVARDDAPAPLQHDGAAAAAHRVDLADANTEATPAPLEVQLRHADGQVAGGALVAVTDATGDVLAETVASAEGRCEFVGWDTAVSVYAAGVSAHPAVLELATGRGAHELHFPAGATLAGRVLIDGAPPGRRFPLALDDWESLPHAMTDYPGNSTAARLPGRAWGHVSGGFLTDADGRFRLSGLPHGWVVKFKAPRHYRRDEARSSPADTALPALDYTLALHAPALITGRVLTSNGEPAHDARVTGWMRFPPTEPREGVIRPGASGWSFFTSPFEADARFEIPLPYVRTLPEALAGSREGREPGAILDLELAARSALHGTLSLERPGVDPSQSIALGDLVLQPSQTYHLLVMDLAGTPLADASVKPERLDRNFGGGFLRTDADGLVSFLAADADMGVATVVAAGHQLVRVSLPPQATDTPIEVRLGVCTSLEIELLAPPHWSRQRAWPLNLQVRGDTPLFEEGAAEPLPIYSSSADPSYLRWRFQNYGSGGGFDVEGEHSFEASISEIPMHLEGLRPHANLRLILGPTRDLAFMGGEFTDPYWESDALWLEPGEQRRLVIDLRDSDRPQPERESDD